MTAPLPYLVIIFKVNELENVFLSDTQNFVNTLTADDRYSLPNTENLKQLIQMQLYQKRKAFSQLFFAFPKSTFNFKHFRQKDDPCS